MPHCGEFHFTAEIDSSRVRQAARRIGARHADLAAVGPALAARPSSNPGQHLAAVTASTARQVQPVGRSRSAAGRLRLPYVCELAMLCYGFRPLGVPG
jgi:hypothetical protein